MFRRSVRTLLMMNCNCGGRVKRRPFDRDAESSKLLSGLCPACYHLMDDCRCGEFPIVPLNGGWCVVAL